jgi:hypothetical protein
LVHLVHLIHADDLKYDDIFRRFFNVFFQRFVIWVSFIDCEDSISWVISDTSIVKVGWRFHGQMLMNSRDTFNFKCDKCALRRNLHDKGIPIPERKIEQPKKESIPNIVHAILAYRTRFKTACHRARDSFGRNQNSSVSPSLLRLASPSPFVGDVVRPLSTDNRSDHHSRLLQGIWRSLRYISLWHTIRHPFTKEPI